MTLRLVDPFAGLLPDAETNWGDPTDELFIWTWTDDVGVWAVTVPAPPAMVPSTLGPLVADPTRPPKPFVVTLVAPHGELRLVGRPADQYRKLVGVLRALGAIGEETRDV